MKSNFLLTILHSSLIILHSLDMPQLDQQVARRLTRFYVIALTVIAVLTVSGLLFVEKTINDLNSDGRIVNVAGRQRMLSQRLTKLAVLQTTRIPTADRVSFDSLLTTWATVQGELRTGQLLMEKPYFVRKSARLDTMFRKIEPIFGTIRSGFAVIASPTATETQRQQALGVVLRDEPAYLRQMNEIVFQFDAESNGRVRGLERVEWVLGIATLLTVLLEGLFIFRPVVRHTRSIIRRLTDSEENLQQTNRQLAIANKELATANWRLRLAQDDLMKATDEKYRLQRAEDTVRSAALLEGQEDERRRFARELHDGIGQMLTGLKLHAGKLKMTTTDDPKQRQRLEDLTGMVQDIIQTTRHISHNLMPSVLGDFGLSAALNLLAEQTAQSSGISVQFTETNGSTGPEGDKQAAIRLAPLAEIGLYRIAQEALHNAVKHARASAINVTIQHEKSPRVQHRITLTIRDNGSGFLVKRPRIEPGQLTTANGLDNMRTRAHLLGATLTITSKLKKGTTILVKLLIDVSRKDTKTQREQDL